MTKEQFDKMYVGEKVAVHCPTEELAKEFLKLAHGFGYCWNVGGSYINCNHWNSYFENTCYSIYTGMFTTIGYYTTRGYKIVEFKHSFTKSDLKSGDKVVYRNGDERYVLVETGGLYHCNVRGNLLENYAENLIDIDNQAELDIMQVYRDNVLIWQREEETPEQKELKEIEEKQRELAEEQKRLADRMKELTNK